jgi:23S rRNA (uridine2552-2'-O)-methyltransferase
VGGRKNEFLAGPKKDCERARHIKVPSSRDESSETYLVATGFRGGEG